MTPGKLSAQAGHAYTDTAHECLGRDPDLYRAYHRGRRGSKVTIEARNLGQIERALRECVEDGLPHALVVDSGHVMPPGFDGSPIVTALGIGPCTREAARRIVKRFGAVR